jgi:hypothetical protein
MPTPGPISKEILLALEKYLIPPLWQQSVSLGYVAAPFAFPRNISARLIGKSVPRADTTPPDFPFKLAGDARNCILVFTLTLVSFTKAPQMNAL